MSADNGEFGEFEHQQLLSYIVEKNHSFTAVALALDREHFADAEFGMRHRHAHLDGIDLGGRVADRRALGRGGRSLLANKMR